MHVPKKSMITIILWLILFLGCDSGGECNCIKNDQIWRTDDGVLSDKSKLPVTKIHSGDTGSSIEKARFSLGILRCLG